MVFGKQPFSYLHSHYTTLVIGTKLSQTPFPLRKIS